MTDFSILSAVTVAESETVVRKDKDDSFKCCFCIDMRTGSSLLLLLEIAYFISFVGHVAYLTNQN